MVYENPLIVWSWRAQRREEPSFLAIMGRDIPSTPFLPAGLVLVIPGRREPGQVRPDPINGGIRLGRIASCAFLRHVERRPPEQIIKPTLFYRWYR
jgi:hypothetical protein